MKATSLSLLLSELMIILMNGCLAAATPEVAPLPEQQSNNKPLTLAQAEELAGFDVKEPAYLPAGVSFDFATYQGLPSPAVTLQFKIVHEQYGDLGRLFQIMQEPRPEAPPDTISCGESVEGCEILQIGDQPLVYRLDPAGPEGLNWYADGFAFRLLRTAGEPNKIYKDDLIKVVESLK